jgi:transposase-like protein
MDQKKSYTEEQKVQILRELLENKVPIIQIAEKYHVHVNDIYNLITKLFEGVSLISESDRPNYQ